MNKITMEFARQDDCLDQMVPSDLRQLIGDKERAEEQCKALAAQVENLKDWRRLALQFDGHRMQAMSMLKMVASGNFDLEDVRQFVAAAPVSGGEHLAQIRAEAIHPIAAERDALAAQVSGLMKIVESNALVHISANTAEISAQAIEQAATYLSESVPDKSHESVIFKDRYVYISTLYLREYAERIRQEVG